MSRFIKTALFGLLVGLCAVPAAWAQLQNPSLTTTPFIGGQFLTSPVISGTLTGTYTLGGTPGVTALAAPILRYALGPNNACNPVTDFGADPTGVVDASTAVNACAAVTKNGQRVNVYLPSGTYYVARALNIGAGQCLYGDGRGNTIITVDQGFDSAATGVVVLAAVANANATANGPCVRNLKVSFAQPNDQATRGNFKTLAQGCTSGNGGTGCKYPPAIFGSGTQRVILADFRVEGAWDGVNIDMTGTNGGCWFDNIEMGALDQGLILGGVHDFCHVAGWHSWNFGFSGTTFSGVYQDGTTIAWQLAEVDALDARGISTYNGHININNASFFGNITNLQLDTSAQLNVTNSSFLSVDNLYSSANSSSPAISLAGGSLTLTNATLERGSGSGVAANVTGGVLQVTGGFTNGGAANSSSMTLSSAGKLFLHDFQIRPGSLTDGTTPIIGDTGGASSSLVMTGVQISGAATNANPAVSISTDTATNYIADNNFNGYTATLGFATTTGYYDFGDVPFTATLTPQFATAGDFTPGSNTSTGSFYFLKGNFVDFTFNDTFNTNAYTTAAGQFSFATNMPTPKTAISQVPGCSFSQIGLVTLAAGWPFCRLQTGTNAVIAPSIMTTNAGLGNFSTTNVPASKTGVTLAGSGRYRIR